MQIFNKDDIIEYDDVFSMNDYSKILDCVYDSKWQFGHGSFHSSDPRSKMAYPFWGMYLKDNDFFTSYLLNIIEERTSQKYELLDVYANGHTHATSGSFHQDCYDDKGRTFLYYANERWSIEWGGKTAFDFGNGKYYFHVPRPNSSILFPGIIPHAAESPSRGFPGLRITIAWKLLIKEQ